MPIEDRRHIRGTEHLEDYEIERLLESRVDTYIPNPCIRWVRRRVEDGLTLDEALILVASRLRHSQPDGSEE